MNPDQSQQQIDPNEAAASLAFATNLQDQMVQHMNPMEETMEAPTEEPEAPQEQADPEAIKEEIMKDVKSAIKEEMSGLREEIKKALSDDNGEQE